MPPIDLSELISILNRSGILCHLDCLANAQEGCLLAYNAVPCPLTSTMIKQCLRNEFELAKSERFIGHEFQMVLAGYEMKSSMSRKGDCWDNAPTESLWGRLKVGRLYGRRFATRREAMDEVMDWLNFYNHKRLHSTLGYVSPMTFEQRWIAAQQQERKSA